MQTSANLAEVLAVVSRILLWSFVLGGLLLLFWLVVFFGFGDVAYQIHANMFDLSKHEFDVINYCGMGLTKLCLFLFFLFPWVGIRLALRKSRKGS